MQILIARRYLVVGIGRRLSLVMRQLAYNESHIVATGPVPEQQPEASVDQRTLTIKFSLQVAGGCGDYGGFGGFGFADY